MPAEQQDHDRFAELLLSSEAARYIGVSKTSFHRALKDELAPAPVTFPGLTYERWRRRELEDWLAAGMPARAHWIWKPSRVPTLEALIRDLRNQLTDLDEQVAERRAELAQLEEAIKKNRQLNNDIQAARRV